MSRRGAASPGNKENKEQYSGVSTLEPVETVVASLIKNLKSKTVSHEDIFELAADAHSNPPYLTRIRKALKKEGIKVLEKGFLEKKKEDDQRAKQETDQEKERLEVKADKLMKGGKYKGLVKKKESFSFIKTEYE